MANIEHLALLKQGSLVWNEWFKQHHKIVPDLTKANLSNLNLSNINLKEANLTQANFSHADLTQANLSNANLEGANFLGANLEGANLKGANLDYVIFSKAIINPKTTIIAAKSLRVYEIINNQTVDRNFANLDLSNSNLFRADLNNADLSNAKLVNVNFNGANLSNAYLYKADLTAANLQNADLTNAYFSHANLTKANLSHAACCGTYFKDAELKFANLKHAKLSPKSIIDVKWYSVWEIVNRGAVGKNLSGVDLSNANLSGANFKEANLSNANLSNAILIHSNLDRANLTNSDLIGANICGVDLEQAHVQGIKLKSVISNRDTHLPIGIDSGRSNLMVKEKPITNNLTLIASGNTQTLVKREPEIQKNQIKVAKNTNLIGIVAFLGMLTLVIGLGYLFLKSNPDFAVQEQQPNPEINIPAK